MTNSRNPLKSAVVAICKTLKNITFHLGKVEIAGSIPAGSFLFKIIRSTGKSIKEVNITS